jgi:hypothetical protein
VPRPARYAARRQRAGRHAAALATGAALGLAPGAWRAAAGNSNFALEFGLPLAIGAALALALAPAYVAAAGRVARGAARAAGA